MVSGLASRLAVSAALLLGLAACGVKRPGTAPDYIDPSTPTTVDADSGCVYYATGTSLIPKYRPNGEPLCLPSLGAAVTESCSVLRDGTPICRITEMQP